MSRNLEGRKASYVGGRRGVLKIKVVGYPQKKTEDHVIDQAFQSSFIFVIPTLARASTEALQQCGEANKCFEFANPFL